MKILALDQSTHLTGYCIAKDQDYIESGVFEAKGSRPDDRLPLLLRFIGETIHRHSIDIIVMEEPAANNYHHNSKTDRELSEVVGAIKAMAILNTCTVVMVYPAQVKASKCSKDNTKYAAALCGKDEVGPDEADALGVWLAYLARKHKQ